MTGRNLGILVAVMSLLGPAGCAPDADPGDATGNRSSVSGASSAPRLQPADTSARTLALVQDWVRGTYDNAAQAAADLADDGIPDDLKHRLVHQMFVPVTVPAMPGYLVFQQSSADGSFEAETIGRAGILQFLIDEETGLVRQRELNFRDVPAWRNAHLDPGRLSRLTLDDVTWDPGCDFLLQVVGDGRRVEGLMPQGTCRIFSPGLGKALVAEDAVTILEDQYWFLGRFVDETGAVMWGNASDEPYRLVRRDQPGPAAP